ncbi:MAG: hypothetical protein JSR37_10195 [Verrucomicrobia bacterium]|nr:hypothetical protein [Verrucomicrobiota bacterium]MBS0636138.1 hypothetical protein [Verrucomicrobiota bacterium]
MKKIFYLLLVTCVSFALFKGIKTYRDRNDGFSVERIQSKLSNSPEWEISTSQQKLQEVNQILAQPFHYLGRGFQFYAFESSDQKYVLKLLRHQRLHPPVLYDWLPNIGMVQDLKAKKSKKRAARVSELFLSLKIAYEEIPVETGLIYVHLNKNKGQHINALLVDLQEDEHKVALDETEFVLQYKADLIKPTFRKLMDDGNIDEAKERINQLFELLQSTAQKGILDTDGALIYKNNVGFIANRAIYIDVGQFTLKEGIKSRERFMYDLKRLKPLYKWLLKHYPSLAAHFEKEKQHILNSF